MNIHFPKLLCKLSPISFHVSPTVQACASQFGINLNLARCISQSPIQYKIGSNAPIPTNWLTYNDKIFPPQLPTEERRPAFVCHMKTNIKVSYKKMWYIACMVRGLKIDEAIDQLKCVSKKGSQFAIDTLEEARDMALREHNVEFGTNLWISESFVGKGLTLKGIRRHGRGRMGMISYRYTHYFVTLEEGEPPKDYYYWKTEFTTEEKLENWLQERRRRAIPLSL